MISIVIPIYNASRTLARCLDSIISQSYHDYEVLMVNDGSIDESAQICQKYAKRDSRFKYIEKENGGVSSSRNIGLKACRGEYVTFVDADDEVNSLWLLTLSSMIGSNESNNWLGVIGFEYIEMKGNNYHVYDCYSNNITSVMSIYDDKFFGSVWNKLFCLQTINEYSLKFDETMHFYEDWLFVASYCNYINKIQVKDYLGYRYYGPENFRDKYEDKCTIQSLLNYYQKLKSSNHECFRVLTDSFLMALCKNTRSQTLREKRRTVRDFKCIIGSDIKYVKGRKKALIRRLAGCKSVYLWRLVISLSSLWID